MRRLTDTHFALNGPFVKLSDDVRIETKDDASLCYLKDLPRDGTVRSIRFEKISQECRDAVSKSFGISLEGMEDEYVLTVDEERIVVYSDTERGLRYGAVAVSTHYSKDGIESGILYCSPVCSFRGAKSYLPAEDKLDEFYRYIDLCMAYGMNTLILELGGAMEYKSHPEIGDSWIDFCRMASEYNGKTNHIQCCMPYPKDSMHIENGGGKVLSVAILRDLAAYAASRGLEIIPEVPTLSHSEYLLLSHPELAENPDDPIPDTYCPSNPATYDLVFDILDDIIDVFHPKTVHLGHDEWYMFCHCEKCKKKTPPELYRDDCVKIRDYLAERGIRTMIWADRFVNAHSDSLDENHGGAYVKVRAVPSGKEVEIFGKKVPCYSHFWSYHADEVCGGELYEIPPTYDMLYDFPKDIILMNWYASLYANVDDDYRRAGERDMVYGNFTPGLRRWFRRIKEGTRGAAISNWGATDFKNLQHGQILYYLAGTAQMMWDRTYDRAKKDENLFAISEDLFLMKNLSKIREGNYLLLSHTADIYFGHRYVGCGSEVYDSDFLIGKYRLTYEDGTTEDLPILFGENIGCSEPVSAHFAHECETVYSTKINEINRHTYYDYLYPTKKRVTRVELACDERYRGQIRLIHAKQLMNGEEIKL